MSRRQRENLVLSTKRRQEESDVDPCGELLRAPPRLAGGPQPGRPTGLLRGPRGDQVYFRLFKVVSDVPHHHAQPLGGANGAD